jgi:hypothetical protein
MRGRSGHRARHLTISALQIAWAMAERLVLPLHTNNRRRCRAVGASAAALMK